MSLQRLSVLFGLGVSLLALNTLFVVVPVFFAAACHVVAVVLDLVEAAWFAARPKPKQTALREKEFQP